ncbi:MAG: hypothetical protein KC561_18605, partial [Myxococcales bacterium]|nr:hypothetical protein [Myxococcales bacterium]
MFNRNRQKTERAGTQEAADTLARVLRVVGKVSASNADRDRADAWARHVLTGETRAIPELETFSPAAEHARAWAEVAAFVEDQLTRRTQSLSQEVSEFRSAFAQILTGLRTMSQAAADDDSQVEERLSGLEEAMASDDFERIKASIPDVVDSVRGA